MWRFHTSYLPHISHVENFNRQFFPPEFVFFTNINILSLCRQWRITLLSENKHSFMWYPLGTYNWLRISDVQELSHIWKQLFSTSYTSQVSCLILYWLCTTQAAEPWVAFLKTFPETETSAALVTRHTPISPTYRVELKMGSMCFRTTSLTLDMYTNHFFFFTSMICLGVKFFATCSLRSGRWYLKPTQKCNLGLLESIF